MDTVADLGIVSVTLVLPFTVQVDAPSRLHFGMFSFGHADVRQYGGLGCMVSAPGIRLRARMDDDWAVVGPLAKRTLHLARKFAHAQGLDPAAAARIEVLRAPRSHAGLGSGTQLALAVAAALGRLFELSDPDPAEMAHRLGRGRRSAIGIHGFQQGGLLVDGGKTAGEKVSPMLGRYELPPDWRFVLIDAVETQGLWGAEERRAFARLPAVPREWTARMCDEAYRHLLPAAEGADFQRFGESLGRFGSLAGACFRSAQHGLYATERAQQIVELLHGMGIAGVGQTSWGPTLFALVDNQAAAEGLVADLQSNGEMHPAICTIAAPCNRGARVMDLQYATVS